MERKIFKHELYPKIELGEITKEGQRVYTTPTGERYESVTTVLGKFSDKTALENWRKRVGYAEALKITKAAANRGTKLHKICENYLLNVEDYEGGATEFDRMMFAAIKPVYDHAIDIVYGIEYPLYSHELQTAGRTDIWARFDGVSSIVDNKSSTKLKKRAWIRNYFLQATTYALMVRERLGVDVPQIVIVISSEDSNIPQVFVERTAKYEAEARAIFEANKTMKA